MAIWYSTGYSSTIGIAIRDQTCTSDCNFELEGFVTSFTSATEFEVDGQPVTTTASTTYVNGTVDTLAIDVRLAVNGTLDTNGVLVADQIVFRLPSLIEIEADVEAINRCREFIHAAWH